MTHVIAEPAFHTQLHVGDPHPLEDGSVIKVLIVDDTPSSGSPYQSCSIGPTGSTSSASAPTAHK